MARCVSIFLAFVFALGEAHPLLADADVPWAFRMRARALPQAEFPAGAELPVVPVILPALDGPQSKPKAADLQPESRLALIRFVSGEFVHALKPLPAGKKGFLLKVGEPLNEQMLHRAVATRGAAVNTGDSAQITHLEFRDHDIIVDINGGGRGKKRWRDRLQIQLGGGLPTVSSTTVQQEKGPPGFQPGMGSTIFVEFGKPLPDLTPEDLKQILSPLLDFSKQRSAAKQWIETLPPEFQRAIKERRAMVGMDREMVVAAIGRPERKVRERDPDGNEIEDWIYGEPPSKTIFVRFMGDRVTGIKEFPQ
jgi:hypothetical protein